MTRPLRHLALTLATWCAFACGGGATFKIAETPWTGADENMQRLQRGAEHLGCAANGPDSTGELEIVCPEGRPSPDSDSGSIRIGPDADDRLLAMCNDGLAEQCTQVLQRIWDAGADGSS